MASSGTGSLVFIDDVTEYRRCRMDSEVYSGILSTRGGTVRGKKSNRAVLHTRCWCAGC